MSYQLGEKKKVYFFIYFRYLVNRVIYFLSNIAVSYTHLDVYKRQTMNQGRLTYLSLLSMENDILHEIDFKDIIDMFAAKKARKVCI